ncbi:MAG: DUF4157 domain-containing protein, partial [Oscillospiraceae bacterium]
METAKISKQQEDSAIRKNTAFSYDSAEREAELISDRFKNSSDVKSEMSSRMGVDFSGVRVHSDDAAHQKAQSLDAAAFTRGSDIYMGSESAIQDAGASNNQVLAHELTHTVQQGTAMQQGEGAVSQSAPTGTVQMFPNIFRRKKKAAAEPTPAPFPTPAPKPAEPMPEVIDKGNGEMDFSNFIEPGRKRLVNQTARWKRNEDEDEGAAFTDLIMNAQFRVNANPFKESSVALRKLMEQRNQDDLDSNQTRNQLLGDREKMESISEKIGETTGGRPGGANDAIKLQEFIDLQNSYTSEMIDNVGNHLDDKTVRNNLSAQSEILNGATNGKELFDNPLLRGSLMLSNYLLLVQQPTGALIGRKLGETDELQGRYAIFLAQNYSTQVNKISEALCAISNRPGFDPSELSDEEVDEVLKIATKKNSVRTQNADAPAVPNLASADVVRKYGKLLSKTIERTMNTTPHADTASDAIAGAIAAATPDAVAAMTAQEVPAAAAPAAAAPAAAAPAAAAPAAAAPAAAAPAPAPLPEIGPPSTPPPALASLP